MSGQAVITIKDMQWQASLAASYAELTTGLKGQAALTAGTGMLFVLPSDQPVAITMQGVNFPIDIIFISSHLQVLDVALGVPPGVMLNENTPVRYFLEVNAGEAEGIESGDPVSIDVIQAVQSIDWISPVVSFAGVMMAGVFVVKMGKMVSDAMLSKKNPTLYGLGGERLLPQTSRGKPFDLAQGKPTRSNVSVDYWEERDRLGIWITDKRTDKSIGEWWDEDAREMFEQGFFRPGKQLEESVLDYAESVGILVGGKYVAHAIRDSYYWTAVNQDTGEIAESAAPYTSSGHALRGGKTFASRHWKGAALVEVWKQPCRYSEKLDIEPVTSETIALAGKKGGGKLMPARLPQHQAGEEGMEFLADSPEFLAYTIDDIGYREKIDTAFLQAIARARGKRR